MDTALPSVPAITPQQLAARIGQPDAPLIVDVRREARFTESPFMLAGALRCAPENLAALAQAGPPGEVVVYCVYGHNVSQEAAAALNRSGWNARFLAGGIEGGQDDVDASEHIRAWRSAGVPAIRKRSDLGVTGEKASRWITRERPKIDRIACPWLVRRFIDPRAEFLYVPADSVLGEARRLEAVAYDIPGGAITHDGEMCSFDALLHAFALQNEALEVLARIVRGADTDRLDLAPQSAGLLAVSIGLSAMHATDDQAMLQAAMPFYDAMYVWCRKSVIGQPEAHSWKPETLSGAVE